jgi:nitroimidazol reductase NimA-like FMN-containing flavoprotein (pyridoxamine 5'-phosphate oxidase superfamily)
MRRRDREITDNDEMESIIMRASVCRLAICDQGTPYLIPLCFGFEGRALYFHSALEGRKLEMLKGNNRVCFEMDVDQELIRSDNGSCSMRYRSIIGFGSMFIIHDPMEKRKALDVIMRHYSQEPFEYSEAVLIRTTVFKVEIESMTGKKSGY